MSELAVGSLSGLAANSYVIDVASGSQLTQPGMVLQVVSTTKTDTFSSSIAGSGSAAVTGLSASCALSNASNKLLITVHIGTAAEAGGRARVGAAVSDGTSFIGVGDAAGSRVQMSAGGYVDGTANDRNASVLSFSFLHSPGTTSSKTYTAHLVNMAGGTTTFYANRSVNDPDNAASQRTVSTITLMEVAG